MLRPVVFHWNVEKGFELCENSPGSRLRTSTDSLRGEMLSAATTHSALRPRLYSTRNAVIGEPPLALGIQVTYTELSVAIEMVGRSGASGTKSKNNNITEKFLKCEQMWVQRTGNFIPPHVKMEQVNRERNKGNIANHSEAACCGGMCTYCLGS